MCDCRCVIAGDDRYLPGPETADGVWIRAAAGLAGWLRSPRRRRGFGGPMLLALGCLVLIAIAITVETVV